MVAGIATVVLVEGISSRVYPPPPGLDMNDAAAMKEFVKGLPTGAFLFVLAAHAAGAFVAGAVCTLVAWQRWPVGSVIVGAVFLVVGITNLLMLPHPTWFIVVDVLVFIPAAFAGGFVVSLAVPASAEPLSDNAA